VIAPAALLAGALQPAQLLGVPARLPRSRRAAGRRDGTGGEPGFTLGDPGRPASVPTLVIALFDDSGSVTGPSGNDPLSNRYAEVERAFTAVARHGSRRELGAVLHFDTPAGDIGPTPLTRRGLQRLRQGLHRPAGAWGISELGTSLDLARRLAGSNPGHAATLVVLSDFELLDADPGRVLGDLHAFPGTVHAVVLGTPVPDGVLTDPIAVTTVGKDARPGAVARALFASLVTHRPGSFVHPEP
jgi:hypothetical protein